MLLGTLEFSSSMSMTSQSRRKFRELSMGMTTSGDVSDFLQRTSLCRYLRNERKLSCGLHNIRSWKLSAACTFLWLYQFVNCLGGWRKFDESKRFYSRHWQFKCPKQFIKRTALMTRLLARSEASIRRLFVMKLIMNRLFWLLVPNRTS